jgi:8-oxo-dGTP pyrophosphatase MutT (NUDIX family)
MSDRTLCFLIRGNSPREVLLGLKKAGFGMGKYAGFGGRIEPGESVETAAIRELEEETGIKVTIDDLHPTGRLTFLFPFQPDWSQVVHVFLVDPWQGTPQETSEMKPEWHRIDQIPFDRMWDDAHYWLPLVLAGQRIDGRFVYCPDNKTVSEVKIIECEDN